MKTRERPIILKAHDVRAILEGRKTQTRRLVKGMALEWLESANFTPAYVADPGNDLCPYGLAGDRLWVRETFALEHDVEGSEPPHSDGRPVLRRPADDVDAINPLWTQAHYRATDPAPDLCCERERCAQCREHDMGPHWRPSIHMPRWASRITLEITGVRVERLQDITEEQAIAEGIRELPLQEGEPGAWWCADPMGNPTLRCRTPRAAFCRLWESINGAGSWAANPWVWVIEFHRIEGAQA